MNVEGGTPLNNNMNNELSNLKIKVGQEPTEMECLYCHHKILTATEDQCNCFSFSFSVLMLMVIIFPIFFIYVLCIDISDCYCSIGCDR